MTESALGGSVIVTGVIYATRQDRGRSQLLTLPAGKHGHRGREQTGANMMRGRSTRTRETVLAVGHYLFLHNGYSGTTVEQIAALAAVSKQTVYRHFDSKQDLLLAIVTNALRGTVTPLVDRIMVLADTTNLQADLSDLAGDYLHAVLDDTAVRLRRLVIAEANRVPALAYLYYERATARILGAFADCFARLHTRGLLHVPEPVIAAEHFTFLVVGRCADQTLFCDVEQVRSALDAHSQAQAGVGVFLASYQSAAPCCHSMGGALHPP